MKSHKLENKILMDDNTDYIVIPVYTGYIKPGESYDIIIENSLDILEEDDFLVVSETPLAISQGRIVDESLFNPSISSFILAEVWSKYLWGYLLGPLMGMKKRTILNLRKLPFEARKHKKLILDYYGLKHALKPASEAGVDLSNAPGTFVSLLPQDPQEISEEMGRKIGAKIGKKVIVMVIDTDATYKLGKIKFTSLPISIPEIRNNMGFFGYLIGRIGKIIGPTPLGISHQQDIDKILQIARIADEYQRKSRTSMETVYDMQKMLSGDINNITVEMLDSISHIPAVIVRKV
ncbi:MAG: coenzyme F420-0:L-glutamate ligase [Methanobacteriaceae archaeon]